MTPGPPADPGAPAHDRPAPDAAPLVRPSFAVPAALLAAVCVTMLLGRDLYAVVLGGDQAIATWSSMFVAVVLQALPFLALGVVVAGAISVLVPDRVLRRGLPRRPLLAVPVATAAGAALPGCECGSVPVAARMVSRGVAPSAALAFMLSSPAVNPVVLVATAVAFPGRPEMVLARALASALVALVVGFLWARFGWPLRGPATRAAAAPAGPDGSRAGTLLLTLRHDFLHAGGLLVVGAAVTATLTVAIPPEWTEALAGVPVVSVLVLAVLAVLLAVCSEADAFVAAGLTAFSPTAQLAFMVVGPAVDVKLVAMHAGTFGPGFAARFAPLVLGVAVLAALGVGGLLL